MCKLHETFSYDIANGQLSVYISAKCRSLSEQKKISYRLLPAQYNVMLLFRSVLYHDVN